MSPEFTPKDVESLGRAETVYQEIITTQPRLAEIPQDQAKELVARGLHEISELEEAAAANYIHPNITPDVANNVKLLWDLSGPGTYDMPTKDDKYKDFPWARNMDRARLNYTARLTKRIAEVKSGVDYNSGSLADVGERKEKTKKLIEEYGPTILYNGTGEENATVEDVLGREGIIIPRSKVHVVGEGIATTVDQVKDFKIPEGVSLDDSGEIGIISHAPHLMRTMHMINRYRPFPEGTKVRLFPLPTPDEGKDEYAMMEARGLLYYTYMSPDKDTTPDAYPYTTLPKAQ